MTNRQREIRNRGLEYALKNKSIKPKTKQELIMVASVQRASLLFIYMILLAGVVQLTLNYYNQ